MVLTTSPKMFRTNMNVSIFIYERLIYYLTKTFPGSNFDNLIKNYHTLNIIQDIRNEIGSNKKDLPY